MRYVALALVAVLALVAALFAIHNHQPLTLSFWPLPVTVTLPVYGVVIGALAIGFTVGAAASWFAGRKWRRLARVRGRENAAMLREMEGVKSENREAKPALPAPPAPPAEVDRPMTAKS